MSCWAILSLDFSKILYVHIWFLFLSFKELNASMDNTDKLLQILFMNHVGSQHLLSIQS